MSFIDLTCLGRYSCAWPLRLLESYSNIFELQELEMQGDSDDIASKQADSVLLGNTGRIQGHEDRKICNRCYIIVF